MERISPRPPRRLPPAERREQLVAAAAAVAAEGGYANLSLDAVADRADVTRNLLYHYFPRGRTDLNLAVLERAGEELTGDWVTDSDLPLADRMAANFRRMFEHASQPTSAWRLFGLSRALTDREVAAMHARYQDRMVAAMALNQFGTIEPPPLGRLALTSFLAYAEVALDEMRSRGLDRDEVARLIIETLQATVAASKAMTR